VFFITYCGEGEKVLKVAEIKVSPTIPPFQQSIFIEREREREREHKQGGSGPQHSLQEHLPSDLTFFPTSS
jgi:hypothetical protein